MLLFIEKYLLAVSFFFFLLDYWLILEDIRCITHLIPANKLLNKRLEITVYIYNIYLFQICDESPRKLMGFSFETEV